MRQDIGALQTWLHICVVIAAVCTTLVPIIYARTKWYRSVLGRLFMLQAISFAIAMVLTAMNHFWQPEPTTAYILSTLVFTMIAGSTLALTRLIWKLNYTEREGEHHDRIIHK